MEVKKIIKYCLIFLFLIGGTIFYLWYKNIFWLNTPSIKEYPVRGIDVSHYQGKIDWNPIGVNYDFVFIKSTEGGDYVDSLFSQNWEGAKTVGLRRGAYHFYRNCTSPELQLKNIIATVPKSVDMLPITVDVEVNNRCEEPQNQELLKKNLNILLEGLENHYDQSPIVYAMKDSYELYGISEFEKNPIWYRSIFTFPYLSNNREWTFWQYSNKGHVKGIDGYVDLNVFNGTPEAFKDF